MFCCRLAYQKITCRRNITWIPSGHRHTSRFHLVEPVLYSFRAASLPWWSLGYWATFGAAAGTHVVKTRNDGASKSSSQCNWIVEKDGVAMYTNMMQVQPLFVAWRSHFHIPMLRMYPLRWMHVRRMSNVSCKLALAASRWAWRLLAVRKIESLWYRCN